MTPKEKAVKLVDKFFTVCHKSSDLELSWKVCKQCAIIAVDEILKELFQFHRIVYYNQVKTEIEKL